MKVIINKFNDDFETIVLEIEFKANSIESLKVISSVVSGFLAANCIECFFELDPGFIGKVYNMKVKYGGEKVSVAIVPVKKQKITTQNQN
jgi:hypothetical protein